MIGSKLAAVVVVLAIAPGLVGQAEAKGCIKGALVGGVAGHYAHHHAILGAIGGCVAGHELAKHKAKLAREREERMNTRQLNAAQVAKDAPQN